MKRYRQPLAVAIKGAGPRVRTRISDPCRSRPFPFDVLVERGTAVEAPEGTLHAREAATDRNAAQAPFNAHGRHHMLRGFPVASATTPTTWKGTEVTAGAKSDYARVNNLKLYHEILPDRNSARNGTRSESSPPRCHAPGSVADFSTSTCASSGRYDSRVGSPRAKAHDALDCSNRTDMRRGGASEGVSGSIHSPRWRNVRATSRPLFTCSATVCRYPSNSNGSARRRVCERGLPASTLTFRVQLAKQQSWRGASQPYRLGGFPFDKNLG